MIKKILPVFILIVFVGVFFWQFLFKGLLPIPSDTIVGLYYPFKDAYLKTNPNGLPFKNFLITDPVRQQIPWKMQAVSAEKLGELPLWNPYNFSGTPLLANFQAGVFYPLNILFFTFSFPLAWSIFILLQPVLAAVFMYLYLKNLQVRREASIFGSITFAFSGFFVSWLTWGNILHTALWLPLILLSIDKILLGPKTQDPRPKSLVLNLKSYILRLTWPLTFVFSLTGSFFAGHLQTFFYVVLVSLVYGIVRISRSNNKAKKLLLFLISGFVFIGLILPQLMSSLQFISLSARSIDIANWRTTQGWFIPWENLLQFIAPDFFGNPSTLNYFGVWNYGEFIGYIGIGALIFAVFSFFRKDKKVLFFGGLLLTALLFSLPTVFAKIPFKFDLPFISTSQPTRLIFIIDFCLSILAALGLDYFLRLQRKTKILHVLVLFSLVFLSIWIGVLYVFKNNLGDFFIVTRQNLILPTVLFIVNSVLIILALFLTKKKYLITFVSLIILILFFDLFRFGLKYEPFTEKKYLFPSTEVTNFIKSQPGLFRVMSSDSTIFPPNFSSVYNIQTLDGYDPLYLLRFGELMAAVGREKPDISSPFGFNRIITPHNYLSNMFDLLNVKYVLTFEEIKDPTFKQVFTDKTIRVYENLKVFPRAFFVNNTYLAVTKQDAINALFDVKYSLSSRAIVEGVTDKKNFKNLWSIVGKINFKSYSGNKIVLTTENTGDAFLVLTDSFYPNWHAYIDGKETKIYLTNYNFRGIIVPKGKHAVEFSLKLF